MAKKLFENTKSGEVLYYISPVSLKTVEVTVVGVAPMTKYPGKTLIKVIRNMEWKSQNINDVILLQANEEYDTDIYYYLALPSKESMALLANQEPPTILCTTKEQLEKWVKETG